MCLRLIGRRKTEQRWGKIRIITKRTGQLPILATLKSRKSGRDWKQSVVSQLTETPYPLRREQRSRS